MADEDATVAAGDESEDDGADGANVEQRLAKLEKLLKDTSQNLEEERKASAGKDKKITELANERKRLQESTLSKDKLLEIREKEQQDREAEWEAKHATELAELESLRIEAVKTKVLAKLEDFPTALADRVKGRTEEEIEADARFLKNLFLKERDKKDNARRVSGGSPRSGGGKQITVTAEDVRQMTPKQKMEWSKTASEEEYNAVFDELHSG